MRYLLKRQKGRKKKWVTIAAFLDLQTADFCFEKLCDEHKKWNFQVVEVLKNGTEVPLIWGLE